MFWSHWSILWSALWNLICKINLDCFGRELAEGLWTRVAIIGKTVWSSSQPGGLEKVEGWGKRKRERAYDLSKCHKEANGEVDSQHFILLSPTTTTITFCLFLGIWRMETHSLTFFEIFHTPSNPRISALPSVQCEDSVLPFLWWPCSPAKVSTLGWRFFFFLRIGSN